MSHSDPAADPADQTQYFTAEDVEKARREAIQQAREEERAKLYPQRDKQKEQFDAMQAEVAELRKAEAARAKEAEKRAAEVEKARKAKEDAEKSAKELLAEREQTWQQKLDDIQKPRRMTRWPRSRRRSRSSRRTGRRSARRRASDLRP